MVRPRTDVIPNPQYLGVKKYGGELVIPGNILVRQRGTQFYPGENVGMGKDHTLFAKAEGHVSFRKRAGGRQYINVLPVDAPKAAE